MAASRLDLGRIAAAAGVIDPVFRATPQYVCEPLSEALGARVVVKVETLNPVRSFKGRGADLLLAGEGFDAAKEAGRRFAAAAGLAFVEDGVGPRLSEGAGSIAVELLACPERFDAVLVALGNGAMLGGMARWFAAHAPAIEVSGVAPAGAPCMAESFRLGRPVRTVADVVLVTDAAMIEAMRLAHLHLGLVLEPSGAAAIAALLADPARFRDRTVGVVLCGGNLAPEQEAWLGTRGAGAA